MKVNEMKKPIEYFMTLASHVSTASKDPSTQVGCVIADPVTHKILGTGYNGFPRGVPDDPALLNDRAQKYPRIIHAELNAVLNAAQDLSGAYAYVTHPPCAQCTAVLIQAGIGCVFHMQADAQFMERFKDSYAISCDMANHANMDIYEIVKGEKGYV